MPTPSGNEVRWSGRPNAIDYLAISTLCGFLFALCAAKSRHRLLWADEIYGHEVLRAKGLTGVIAGWREGADGGGILYYLLGRAWTDILGGGPLSLRMFSTAGFAGALIVLWVSIRPYFSALAVAVASAVVICRTPCLLWQATNGRFYGLFFFAFACVFSTFLKMGQRSAPVRGKQVLLFFFSHLLLVGSHVLGVVYSMVFVVAMVVLDRTYRRWEPHLYLAAASSWLLIPLSYRAIKNTAAVGKQGFWTHPPTLTGIRDAFFGFNSFAMHATEGLCLVLCGVMLCRRFALLRSDSPLWSRRYRSAIAAVLASFVCELVIAAKSHTGVSVFADRYLLPLDIGALVVLAGLTEQILRVTHLERLPELLRMGAITALILLCCAKGARRHDYDAVYPTPADSDLLLSQLPSTKTLVVVDLETFLHLLTYGPSNHQYVFPIGPEFRDVRPASQTILANWRRAGYEPDHLLSCRQILDREDHFTLLTRPKELNEFVNRLSKDPAIRLERAGTIHGRMNAEMWDVQRDGVARLCN